MANHWISEQPGVRGEEQVKVAGYKAVSPNGEVPMENPFFQHPSRVAIHCPLVFTPNQTESHPEYQTATQQKEGVRCFPL